MNADAHSPTWTVRDCLVSDLTAVRDLHSLCFSPDEHVPMMLGGRYVLATYRWLSTGPRSYCLVAADDATGTLVGACSISDQPYARPMFIACLPTFIMSVALRPNLLLRSKLWRRLFRSSHHPPNGERDSPPDGLAEVATVLVHPAWRGRGIFEALMRSSADRSAARGNKGIKAGVYKSNTASRRAFSKLGWKEAPALETGDTVFYVAEFGPNAGIGAVSSDHETHRS
ncbi:MAG: GNAT family N-acetyltransferase [Acidobacteria bacterium]|nr:GNAT family N-acetyltransferase [Acidobacteriota bacterium]